VVAAGLAALAAVATIAGCERGERRPAVAIAIPVEVFADTSRSVTLHVAPPPAARVWLRGVTVKGPAAIEAPLPAAEPAAPPPDTTAPPAPPIDPALKPPILRSAARLFLPASRSTRAEAVELDVRVSDAGDVLEARWAGGSADTALADAAIACARSMTFHPALLGGRPVSVWCRQRFEFPGR
jgi:outer membrane biosynthesis protein TonB